MDEYIGGRWLEERGRWVSEIAVEKVASQYGRDNGVDMW